MGPAVNKTGRTPIRHEDLGERRCAEKRLSAVSCKCASRAFMNIQRLKRIGAAILVFRASTSLRAVPAT